MLIKARLQGHEFDLLTLAELFRAGDPAVATDDEGYCLSFTAPDRLLDDGARLSHAASVLRRVNGVARTLSSDLRPVGLTGRFSDETGRQHQLLLPTENVSHSNLGLSSICPGCSDPEHMTQRPRSNTSGG